MHIKLKPHFSFFSLIHFHSSLLHSSTIVFFTPLSFVTLLSYILTSLLHSSAIIFSNLSSSSLCYHSFTPLFFILLLSYDSTSLLYSPTSIFFTPIFFIPLLSSLSHFSHFLHSSSSTLLSPLFYTFLCYQLFNSSLLCSSTATSYTENINYAYSFRRNECVCDN
jgi:hypothetical protein